MLVPGEGFLERLREATERLGILLIFDEVISFRVAPGGAQERFGIRPDLTTLGKIIGGGLAVGAFGGRADVMNYYDPRGGKGRISHGGTFNANPVTMAGGVATHRAAHARGLREARRARRSAARRRQRGLPESAAGGQMTGLGSLFWLHRTKKRLSDYRSAAPTMPSGRSAPSWGWSTRACS